MSRLTLLNLALLTALGVWLFWRGELAAPPTTEASSSQPRYHIENLRALRTDAQGQPLLRVTAAAADYFDGGAATLTQIEAVGLSGDAAPWSLNAPAGSMMAGDQRLLLHTPVKGAGRWSSGEAFTFVGSEVWVDDTQRTFYSSQPLTLDGPTRKARARGFVANFDGTTLKLTQPELSYVLEN